jgi:DNA-binding beta-propeller fold protein YncE
MLRSIWKKKYMMIPLCVNFSKILFIPRVQKFDTNGNFITKWGSYGTGDGQFIDPEHLAIDSDGFAYVSDKGRNDIQVSSL